MRKYSSLSSDAVAIDRELDTTGYDTVKLVADNLTALTNIDDNLAEILDSEANAAEALASQIACAADLALTNADVILTGLDVDFTNADVILTGLDVDATNINVVLTGLNVNATNADLAATAQDVIDCAAEVANAATEVTYSEEWANKAEDSLISAAAGGNEVDEYSAKHWSAKAEDFAGAGTGVHLGDISVAGDINADGGRIKFPATANSSTDVNTLDDYSEELVTVTFGTNTGTVTLENPIGRRLSVTKIGRLVHVVGILTIDSISSPTDVCWIEGLPYTNADDGNSSKTVFPIHVRDYTGTINGGYNDFIRGELAGNSSSIRLNERGYSDGISAFLVAGMQFSVNFCYYTND